MALHSMDCRTVWACLVYGMPTGIDCEWNRKTWKDTKDAAICSQQVAAVRLVDPWHICPDSTFYRRGTFASCPSIHINFPLEFAGNGRFGGFLF